MARCRQEQIFEMAEDVRTDGFAFEAGEEHPILSLAVEHVEVVHPEVDQHLVQLPLAVGGAQELGRLQLLHHLARRAVELPAVLLHDFPAQALLLLLLVAGLFYYRQRQQWSSAGRYARSLDALNAGTIIVAGLDFKPVMQATDTMYEISAAGFGGTVVHIRQDGKVWLTK